MQEHQKGRLLRLVSKHYVILLGAVYLFAAIVGTAYYLFYFDYFGLRVFDYWTPSDVLLAAFRQPVSILVGLGAVAIMLPMVYEDEYNAWLRSKGERWWKWLGNYYTRRLGMRIRGWFAVLFAIFWFLFVVHGTASGSGEDVWAGRTAHVEIGVDDSVLSGHFIAATDNYVVILLDEQNGARKTMVLPVQSLQYVRLCAEQGGWIKRLVNGSTCSPHEQPEPEIEVEPANEAAPEDEAEQKDEALAKKEGH